jgi:hypothetical protein
MVYLQEPILEFRVEYLQLPGALAEGGGRRNDPRFGAWWEVQSHLKNA